MEAKYHADAGSISPDREEKQKEKANVLGWDKKNLIIEEKKIF